MTAVQQMPLSRIRDAFLERTSEHSEENIALRGITLHMLQRHAPHTFSSLLLEPVLEQTLARLKAMPHGVTDRIDADRVMARLDACYLLHQRGLNPDLPDRSQLQSYVDGLAQAGYRLHAWLIAELGRATGLSVRFSFSEQEARQGSPNTYPYWLTHVFFLETSYLLRPLPASRLAFYRQELQDQVSRVIRRGLVDVGAELAVCLQEVGLQAAREHQSLMELIAAHVQEDGTVLDSSRTFPEAEVNHTTAVALLALAGNRERSGGGIDSGSQVE